jgi:hypothetical protein
MNELDPRHQRLLEWEMTPIAMREPSTFAALAEEIGYAQRTLRDWKERPDFQAAWRQAFNENAGSLAKTKQIMDVLFEDATSGAGDKRVQAAKLYFDIAKQIAPPEPEPEKSRRAAELSDAELAEMLSDRALEELESRGCVLRLAGVDA